MVPFEVGELCRALQNHGVGRRELDANEKINRKALLASIPQALVRNEVVDRPMR